MIPNINFIQDAAREIVQAVNDFRHSFKLLDDRLARIELRLDTHGTTSNEPTIPAGGTDGD